VLVVHLGERLEEVDGSPKLDDALHGPVSFLSKAFDAGAELDRAVR